MMTTVGMALLKLIRSPTFWWIFAGSAALVSIYGVGFHQGGKGKAEVVKEFKEYKKEQVAAIKELKVELNTLAVTANQNLKKQEIASEEQLRKQQIRLAKLKPQLDSIKLPVDVVKLFNDSTVAPRKEGESTTTPGVDTDGVSNEEAGTDQTTGLNRETTVKVDKATLFNLLDVSLKNNKSHLNCIEQVEEWQDFYTKLYQRFDE